MKKSTLVIICANALGQVVVKSEGNPLYGYIRVSQNRMVVDEQGAVRRVPLSAIIWGLVEDLEAFGYAEGQEIAGKIIFKEGFIAPNPKKPEQDLKIAGETGIVCVQGEKKIYRKNFYSQNSEASDVAVSHTNTEEIKAAFAVLKAKEAKL